MYIVNSGVIAPFGRGIDAFKSVVAGDIQSKEHLFSIPKKSLSTRTISPKLRRADRFTKMSVIAAYDALTGRPELEHIDRSRVGIIMCTAFGPHSTTFKFLDDILQFGDDNASAITFSHSVHNAATSYIALALGITGPTTTITQFHNPFEYGVMLAECWLNEKRCDHVLLCMCDERGAVFDYIVQENLNVTDNPTSFSFETEAVTPSEGSVALLLQRNKENCRSKLSFTNEVKETTPVIINSNGLPQDSVIPNTHCFNLFPCYGTLLGSIAFDTVFATLLLDNPELAVDTNLQQNKTENINSSIICKSNFNMNLQVTGVE